MQYLNAIDYSVIVVYFCFLVGLGFTLQKKASASLEDYFLGGRNLPWWALGTSGMASFLDITGTMIITSFLFMMGPRGMFIEFRGGAVLVLIPLLLFTGKWHRRSGCMTGAEWMIYRFGDDGWGQAARIMKTVAEIIFTIGMIAYLVKGVGLFLSMFLPYTPLQCSLVMIGVATVYTLASGFYGVVITDIVQSVIILAGTITISILAFIKSGSSEQLAALATEVTNNSNWMSTTPHFQTSMPTGHEAYQNLFMFTLFFALRSIFTGCGSGDDPKYFGAKSDRECGKLSFMWICMMTFRWPMMIGFAILGLFLVKDLFPDQAVLLQTADLIKTHVTQIDQSRWADTIAAIMNNPQKYPAEMIEGIKGLLGEGWMTKLNLVSFHGNIDPERILPAVILTQIPMGARGMILVVLLAASMSTFDSTVNKTAGFFTRDIYQRYLRPKASNRELIHASWAFCFVIVTLGYIMGYSAKSINDIWGWIMSGLGGGLLVPFILRFYWWRFNASGFAIGLTLGLIGALLQRLLKPEMHEIAQFFTVLGIGSVGTLLGTYVTGPTTSDVLENFYKTTRPFGVWGHLKKRLLFNEQQAITKEHWNDLISIPFAFFWQVTLFMLPMLIIIRNVRAFWVAFSIFIISLAGMYLFWYRNLPKDQQESK